MRDIYSPLEIDEEWDNFSPVDTTMAPAQEIQPAMPPKMVEVQDESKIATPATQAAAAPPEGPTNTNSFTDSGSNTANIDTNINDDAPKDSADPAWKAASEAISASPENTDNAVNGNIADWMKNDDIPAYNSPDNKKDDTDTLEIADTGATPEAPASDNAVKVNVNSEPSPAPETETQPDEDSVAPVVIDTTSTSTEVNSESPSTEASDEPKPEPEEEPVAEEEHKLGWEDGKEAGAGSASAIEDAKSVVMEQLEGLKDELSGIEKSIEAMQKDKKDTIDKLNSEVAALDDGIDQANKKKAELNDFIAKLEALK